MNPFKRLGLPQDADIPAIKRAYAKKLKQTRPDEDPQGFQHLHEAYQQALAAAEYRLQYGDADGLDEDDDASAEDADLDEATTEASPPTAEPDVDSDALPLDMTFWRDDADSDHDGERKDADAIALPLHPSSDPTDASTENGDVFYLHPFLQELHEVAARPEASLTAWLQRHPALYSLSLKQALIQPMLQALDDDYAPMRPKALEQLLQYFQLDVVQPREAWIHWRVQHLRELSAGHWAMEAELWRLQHNGKPIERFILSELQRPQPSWRRWLIALVPGLPGQAHTLTKRLAAVDHQSSLPTEQLRFWSDFGDDGKLFLPRILAMFARCLMLTGALFLLALNSGDTLFFPRALAIICTPWLATYGLKLFVHAMDHRSSGWMQHGWRRFKALGGGLLEGMRSQSLWRWMLMIYLGIMVLRACSSLAG